MAVEERQKTEVKLGDADLKKAAALAQVNLPGIKRPAENKLLDLSLNGNEQVKLPAPSLSSLQRLYQGTIAAFLENLPKFIESVGCLLISFVGVLARLAFSSEKVIAGQAECLEWSRKLFNKFTEAGSILELDQKNTSRWRKAKETGYQYDSSDSKKADTEDVKLLRALNPLTYFSEGLIKPLFNSLLWVWEEGSRASINLTRSGMVKLGYEDLGKLSYQEFSKLKETDSSLKISKFGFDVLSFFVGIYLSISAKAGAASVVSGKGILNLKSIIPGTANWLKINSKSILGITKNSATLTALGAGGEELLSDEGVSVTRFGSNLVTGMGNSAIFGGTLSKIGKQNLTAFADIGDGLNDVYNTALDITHLGLTDSNLSLSQKSRRVAGWSMKMLSALLDIGDNADLENNNKTETGINNFLFVRAQEHLLHSLEEERFAEISREEAMAESPNESIAAALETFMLDLIKQRAFLQISVASQEFNILFENAAVEVPQLIEKSNELCELAKSFFDLCGIKYKEISLPLSQLRSKNVWGDSYSLEVKAINVLENPEDRLFKKTNQLVREQLGGEGLIYCPIAFFKGSDIPYYMITSEVGILLPINLNMIWGILSNYELFHEYVHLKRTILEKIGFRFPLNWEFRRQVENGLNDHVFIDPISGREIAIPYRGNCCFDEIIAYSLQLEKLFKAIVNSSPESSKNIRAAKFKYLKDFIQQLASIARDTKNISEVLLAQVGLEHSDISIEFSPLRSLGRQIEDSNHPGYITATISFGNHLFALKLFPDFQLSSAEEMQFSDEHLERLNVLALRKMREIIEFSAQVEALSESIDNEIILSPDSSSTEMKVDEDAVLRKFKELKTIIFETLLTEEENSIGTPNDIFRGIEIINDLSDHRLEKVLIYGGSLDIWLEFPSNSRLPLAYCETQDHLRTLFLIERAKELCKKTNLDAKNYTQENSDRAAILRAADEAERVFAFYHKRIKKIIVAKLADGASEDEILFHNSIIEHEKVHSSDGDEIAAFTAQREYVLRETNGRKDLVLDYNTGTLSIKDKEEADQFYAIVDFDAAVKKFAEKVEIISEILQPMSSSQASSSDELTLPTLSREEKARVFAELIADIVEQNRKLPQEIKALLSDKTQRIVANYIRGSILREEFIEDFAKGISGLEVHRLQKQINVGEVWRSIQIRTEQQSADLAENDSSNLFNQRAFAQALDFCLEFSGIDLEKVLEPQWQALERNLGKNSVDKRSVVRTIAAILINKKIEKLESKVKLLIVNWDHAEEELIGVLEELRRRLYSAGLKPINDQVVVDPATLVNSLDKINVLAESFSPARNCSFEIKEDHPRLYVFADTIWTYKHAAIRISQVLSLAEEQFREFVLWRIEKKSLERFLVVLKRKYLAFFESRTKVEKVLSEFVKEIGFDHNYLLLSIVNDFNNYLGKRNADRGNYDYLEVFRKISLLRKEHKIIPNSIITLNTQEYEDLASFFGSFLLELKNQGASVDQIISSLNQALRIVGVNNRDFVADVVCAYIKKRFIYDRKNVIRSELIRNWKELKYLCKELEIDPKELVPKSELVFGWLKGAKSSNTYRVTQTQFAEFLEDLTGKVAEEKKPLKPGKKKSITKEDLIDFFLNPRKKGTRNSISSEGNILVPKNGRYSDKYSQEEILDLIERADQAVRSDSAVRKAALRFIEYRIGILAVMFNDPGMRKTASSRFHIKEAISILQYFDKFIDSFYLSKEEVKKISHAPTILTELLCKALIAKLDNNQLNFLLKFAELLDIKKEVVRRNILVLFEHIHTQNYYLTLPMFLKNLEVIGELHRSFKFSKKEQELLDHKAIENAIKILERRFKAYERKRTLEPENIAKHSENMEEMRVRIRSLSARLPKN